MLRITSADELEGFLSFDDNAASPSVETSRESDARETSAVPAADLDALHVWGVGVSHAAPRYLERLNKRQSPTHRGHACHLFP